MLPSPFHPDIYCQLFMSDTKRYLHWIGCHNNIGSTTKSHRPTLLSISLTGIGVIFLKHLKWMKRFCTCEASIELIHQMYNLHNYSSSQSDAESAACWSLVVLDGYIKIIMQLMNLPSSTTDMRYEITLIASFYFIICKRWSSAKSQPFPGNPQHL